MASGGSNFSTFTPIHTDFGSNTGDILVAEYDVPQTNVKKNLFYQFGQLSIPKWALIPAGILAFGVITALLATILSAVLSQPSSSVTYSQSCSITAKCKTDLGLQCSSQSKCTCATDKYWYEGKCVDQPTYGQHCNQTSECRTDLGLICAEFTGECNCPNPTVIQTCDCSATSYWTGSACQARANNLGACTVADISYQCISNMYCDGSKCTCSPSTQYWNATAQQCFSADEYLELCDPTTPSSCAASASLSCLPAGQGAQCPFNATASPYSCDCSNGSYWNGGSCVSTKTSGAACFWNCECNTVAGLQCLNMTCVCPKKFYWSSGSQACLPQMNYNQTSCSNTSQCDTTQGLTCYQSGVACNCPATSTTNMCDCLSTQYYDYNYTACQTLKLYNDTCLANYMCDSTLGLFCQTTLSSLLNCSCPQPIRLNMCDCNTSSYWNGITCTPRLAANFSCSYAYQCQASLTCIVNETTLGIFSDVCRCPLGNYFVNGSGCIPSVNYTQSCIGSYQCYEPAPLSCRYNATGLTCLDTSAYPLPRCDCSDYYFYNQTSGLCIARLSRFDVCDSNCECTPPFQCIASQCDCVDYYSSINRTCVVNLWYGDQCSNTADCEATPNAFMTCVSGTCRCNSSGSWNGTQCSYVINFRATCTSSASCVGGLVCRSIACIGGSNRCSCNTTSYFSVTNQACISCTGSAGNSFNRYVINYPNSDICVAVRDASSSPFASVTFAQADSSCSGFTSITTGGPPQLLSVHNSSELNCIAEILRGLLTQAKCSSNQFYYLGYSNGNGTFYDGTLYSSVFSSPTLTLASCLTYCSASGTSGQLNSEGCNGGSWPSKYGAICDYRVT